MNSKYKCYQGSKRLHPGGHFPVLIIVAQIGEPNSFSEHFIFTGVNKYPFLHASTDYELGKSGSKEDFKKLITVDVVLSSETERATAHLESKVFESDKNLHQKVFWEGSNFEYREVDDKALIHLAMNKDNKSLIEDMFEKTSSHILEDLEQRLKVITKIDIKSD